MWSYMLLPKIINMSLTGSLVILAVLAARFLLRRAPRILSYLLWSVVLFRLLCPVSFSSPVSLLNLLGSPARPGETIGTTIDYIPENIVHTNTPQVTLPLAPADDAVNSILPQGAEQTVADPLEAPVSLLTLLWLAGICVMVGYSAVSLLQLHKKLRTAVPLHKNILLADAITSPFVLGLFRPKIYLPSSLSPREMDYILLHEQHHIRRLDHLTRILAFTALCIHWFNPLVWAAFFLSGKDMEMSCDEAVMRKMQGEDIRADYAQSLLRLATGQRSIAATPLAFGEGDTAARITNILHYKKPAFWAVLLGAVLLGAATVMLVSNPVQKQTELSGANYSVRRVLYDTSLETQALPACPFCITADLHLYARNDFNDPAGLWTLQGKLERYPLTKQELKQLTPQEDSWSSRYRIPTISEAYILRLEDQMFYLAAQTQTGETLIGYGWEDISERSDPGSDDTCLYWLCELESEFAPGHINADFFNRSLSAALQREVDCFAFYEMEDHPDYVTVGFTADILPLAQDQMRDMGYAVFIFNGTGYRLLTCRYYENAALTENGIYVCADPATLNHSGELAAAETYDVVLCKNENLATIVKEVKDADGNVVRTLREAAGSKYSLNMFSWAEQHTDGAGSVSMHCYDKTGHEISYGTLFTEKDLDTVTADVLRSQYSAVHTPNAESLQAIAYYPLGRAYVSGTPKWGETGHTNILKQYLMVLYQEYTIIGDALICSYSSYLPVVHTFTDDGSTYQLTDTWMPETFDAAAKSDRIPDDILQHTQDTMEPQRAELEAECLHQAYALLYARMDEYFEAFTAAAGAGSAPQHYLSAYPEVYAQLMETPQLTRDYIYAQFCRGGQTGLKGQLMRLVLDDIISGEALKLQAANGQAYFDALLAGAQSIQAQHGLVWMEKNTPHMFRLLQIHDNA